MQKLSFNARTRRGGRGGKEEDGEKGRGARGENKRGGVGGEKRNGRDDEPGAREEKDLRAGDEGDGDALRAVGRGEERRIGATSGVKA